VVFTFAHHHRHHIYFPRSSSKIQTKIYPTLSSQSHFGFGWIKQTGCRRTNTGCCRKIMVSLTDVCKLVFINQCKPSFLSMVSSISCFEKEKPFIVNPNKKSSHKNPFSVKQNFYYFKHCSNKTK
jgi:hypothetical protein